MKRLLKISMWIGICAFGFLMALLVVGMILLLLGLYGGAIDGMYGTHIMPFLRNLIGGAP